MRNLKKFLALVLAMLMVVSAAATVSAFDDVAADHQYVEAINDLSVKLIVKGVDEENTIYAPEGAVTRKQAAIMFARATTGITDDAEWQKGGLTTFTDVTDWKNAIATVAQKGIISGWTDLDGKLVFDPEGNIQYAQGLKMAVCALGYEVKAIEGAAWWLPYYNKALEIGLTANLEDIATAETALNRGQFAQLIFNMLYADPADGGDCLASKYFNLKTATNATTFAITATKQQYVTGQTIVTADGYVGVQEIVNDVPSGEVYYIKTSEFGFTTDAEAEAAFLHAYDFINWDAEELTYGDIQPAGSVSTIYSTEITEGTNTFKVGNVTYYTVEENTATPIKNEVVLFDINNEAYVHTEKILLLDRFGEMVDINGDLILKAIYSVSGEIIAYQAFQDANGVALTTPVLMTEEVAKATYGKEITDANDKSFKFMQGSDLGSSYVLTAFDDDNDSFIDRAYYNKVYISVNEASKQSNNALKYGPMYTANKANPTFIDTKTGATTTLADGQVFKYTYNEQLNTVYVLDTYATETGVLTWINTVNDYASKNYAVELTINGKTYTMANETREGKDLLAGAELTKNGSYTTYNKTGATLASLTDTNGSYIGYTYYNDTAFNKLIAGSLVKFLAIGDEIVLIDTYTLEDNYELVLVDKVTNFDTDAIYMDVYMGGKSVKDFAVTKIWDERLEKYISISDLNVFQLSNLLGTIQGVEGNLYRAIVNSKGGYQLSEPLTPADAAALTEYIGTDNKIATNNKFKLAPLNLEQKIIFNDGIADTYVGGFADNEDTLIVNSNTKFYFVKVNAAGDFLGSIIPFQGDVKDGSTINLANATVLADKIGFATGATTTTASATYPINGLAGTAGLVVVYYQNATDISGFGVTSVGEKLVYVSNAKGSNAVHDAMVRPRQYAEATYYGLDAYAGTNLYWYNGAKLAVDMATGAAVTDIYTDEKLDFGKYYVLSYDNVVLAKEGDTDFASYGYAFINKNVKAADIVSARYWTIKDVDGNYIFTTADKVSKIAIYDAAITDLDVNTAEDVLAAGSVITYINDIEDKTFVAIVGAAWDDPSDNPPTGTVSITVNAMYGTSGAESVAQSTTAVATNKQSVTTTFKAIDKAMSAITGTVWGTTQAGVKGEFTTTGVVYTLGSIQKLQADGVTVDSSATIPASTAQFAVDSNKDLVVTITVTQDTTAPTAVAKELASGTYKVTFTEDYHGNTYVYTYWFTVPAAN